MNVLGYNFEFIPLFILKYHSNFRDPYCLVGGFAIFDQATIIWSCFTL